MLHIYPTNELKEHDIETTMCECFPKLEIVEGEMLIIHNSFDGREAVEFAKDILSNSDNG